LRICVVGCGALGGIFAAHLAQLPDVETFAYDVDAAHVEAINERGLRLTGVGELRARLAAATEPDELPPCRFGIVATKALHTGAAIAATAHLFRGGSVCTVQNGIGNEHVLADHVERVIAGTAFPGGTVREPGVIGWDTAGQTTIGPFGPAPAPMSEVEALAAVLSRSGMPTRAVADARGAQWTKIVFNAAANSVGALTGLPHGRVCDDSALRALVSGLVAEGSAVARTLGVELDGDPEALVELGHRVAYEHRSSMLQDVLARRPTEVDVLNEAIARLGRQAGVPTPLNDAVAALVKGVERSWGPGRDSSPPPARSEARRGQDCGRRTPTA